MKKRSLFIILAALMTLSLAACHGSGIIASDVEFQKNMHQSSTYDLQFASETEDGIYFQGADATMLYYLNKTTKKATILCGKPECDHSDNTCDAYAYARSLWYSGGKLYFSNNDRIIENGTPVNYGNRIFSIDTDGTDRRAVQKLEFTPSGDTTQGATLPILHRGQVYFVNSGVLYTLPLGGDIQDAEKIWGEEIGPSGNIFESIPVSRKLTLWADGDTLYFMANLSQSNGTYKETLFACDIDTREVAQVWQAPDKDQVGQWETTGVSVSQWYVLDGVVYFYLSGGDFWKTDLATGETVKLADTHEKTQYGTAVFNDDCLCLLNDGPDPKYAGASAVYGSGGMSYVGGDTVYVYGLNGSFKKELSLKALYDELEGLQHIALGFCTGGDLYFMAETETTIGGPTTDGAFTSTGKTLSGFIMCCVNIETGEITRIASWEFGG